MDTSNFIANRVAFSNSKSFTKWIIRIAITAVGLSLAVIIIAYAMISGFKKEISEKIFGFWGHIHITDANISRSLEAIPILKSQDFLSDLDTLDNITYQMPLKIFGRTIPGRFTFKDIPVNIISVYPFAMSPAIINSKDEYLGIIVRGVENYNWDHFQKYIVEGRSINEDENSSEVLISASIANTLHLGLNDDIIINVIKDGQQIRRKVTIVGIYKTGLEEYDKKFIISSLSKVQELLKWQPNQVAGYEIILDDISNVNIINEVIYFDVLPSKLYSETIRDKFPNIFEWLDLQDLNAIVILILMIIVAIMNMITGIIILIIERSRMVGTLMSLGMSNWDIRKIFLYYAAYITLFGLILGNIIGIGLSLIQKYTGFIKLNEENYYLAEAPIHLDLVTIIILNVITFFIILIFLLLPTLIISRLSPVKILRFQ